MQGGNHAVGPEDVSAAEGAGRERRGGAGRRGRGAGGLAPLLSAAVCLPVHEGSSERFLFYNLLFCLGFL